MTGAAAPELSEVPGTVGRIGRIAALVVMGLAWVLFTAGTGLAREAYDTIDTSTLDALGINVAPEGVNYDKGLSSAYLFIAVAPIAVAIVGMAKGGFHNVVGAFLLATALVCSGAWMDETNRTLNDEGYDEFCDLIEEGIDVNQDPELGEQLEAAHRLACVSVPLVFTGGLLFVMGAFPLVLLTTFVASVGERPMQIRAAAGILATTVAWLCFTIAFALFNDDISEFFVLGKDGAALFMLAAFTPLGLIFACMWVAPVALLDAWNALFARIVAAFAVGILPMAGGALYFSGLWMDDTKLQCRSDETNLEMYCQQPQAMFAGAFAIAIACTVVLMFVLNTPGAPLPSITGELATKGAICLVAFGWLLAALGIAIFRGTYQMPEDYARELLPPVTLPHIFKDEDLDRNMVPAYMLVVFGLAAVVMLFLTRFRDPKTTSMVALSILLVAMVGVADVMNVAGRIVDAPGYEEFCVVLEDLIDDLGSVDSNNDGGVPRPVRQHERKQQDCAPGCSAGMIGNGICDFECVTVECNFDFPDCYYYGDDDDLSGDPDNGGGASGPPVDSGSLTGSFDLPISAIGLSSEQASAAEDIYTKTHLFLCVAPQLSLTGSLFMFFGAFGLVVTTVLGDGLLTKAMPVRVVLAVLMFCFWMSYVVSFGVFADNTLAPFVEGGPYAFYHLLAVAAAAAMVFLCVLVMPKDSLHGPTVKPLALVTFFIFTAGSAIMSSEGRRIYLYNDAEICDAELTDDQEQFYCTLPAALFATAFLLAVLSLVIFYMAHMGSPIQPSTKPMANAADTGSHATGSRELESPQYAEPANDGQYAEPANDGQYPEPSAPPA